ncbi:MAG: hypothetical protein Q7R50_07140 [Dehalococcoidales bacterium]|nr:hypothetical protein [Dehalococcoidales bacterium]
MQHQIVLDKVKKRLVEGARKRETVFYEDFLADASYGVVEEQGKPNKLGTILREISREEVLMGNPPLSAICVLKKEGTPGPEFRSFMDPAEQLNEQQLNAMWQFIRDAVFDYYEKKESSKITKFRRYL